MVKTRIVVCVPESERRVLFLVDFSADAYSILNDLLLALEIKTGLYTIGIVGGVELRYASIIEVRRVQGTDAGYYPVVIDASKLLEVTNAACLT